MADSLTADQHRLLTKENLQDAYSKLLLLFKKYDIPVTFAFVMAFTLSESERNTYRDSFLDIDVNGRNWLKDFRIAQDANNTDGWFCPDALDMVLAEDSHEVACHGFTHLPLHPDLVSLKDAQYELNLCDEIASMKGISLNTFVYPRNLVGYTNELEKYGYIGYRELIDAGTSRIKALMREFDIFSRAQQHIKSNSGVFKIPAGYILNPGVGIRKRIPTAITKRRWESILNSSVNTNSTAHMWFHPHNIITYPEMYGVLEFVLHKASEFRDRGDLDCLTQQAYVRTVQDC